MALYMKIPKDMNGIKDTVMFKMTKRQLIFNAIGLALGFTVFWLTYKTLGTSTSALLLFCLGSPFFIMGMYEKNEISIYHTLYSVDRAVYPVYLGTFESLVENSRKRSVDSGCGAA